jgi:hypothetical protein
VAKPNAHGQAINNTVIAERKASSRTISIFVALYVSLEGPL